MPSPKLQPSLTTRSSRDLLKNERRIEDLVETFKVLSDQTRLRIALTLLHDEKCVREIAELLQLSESAVSHQLRVLRSLRLVKYRRDGKQMYYSLDDAHIEQLILVATEHVSER